jgi:hypothetical protein
MNIAQIVKTSHPIGECPMTEVTCFLCEGIGQVPSQCYFYHVVQRRTQQAKDGICQSLVNNHEDRRPEKKKKCNNLEGDDIIQLTCYNCKEQGHYASKCLEKKKNKARKQEVAKESSKKDISQVECHGCQKLGHYAWNCLEKMKGISQTHFRRDMSTLLKWRKF